MQKSKKKTNRKTYSLWRGQSKCYDSLKNVYTDKLSTWVADHDLVSQIDRLSGLQIHIEDAELLLFAGVHRELRCG